MRGGTGEASGEIGDNVALWTVGTRPAPCDQEHLMNAPTSPGPLRLTSFSHGPTLSQEAQDNGAAFEDFLNATAEG